MCLYPEAFLFSTLTQGLQDSLPFQDFVVQKEMLLLNLNGRKEKNWKLLQEEGATCGFVVSHHHAS